MPMFDILLVVLFRTLNSSRDLPLTAWQNTAEYLSRPKQEHSLVPTAAISYIAHPRRRT